ncbi:site-specific integrase [Tenacibaculum finnmarkense genomovar finnmarkense]|uniref:tyrosine-type recombinase/integrase n=2 Tax=Tenacibaculum finnmarkense TaxID=2781243 RepID=UPI001EFAE6E3|nr:site-specific integrase [Tenacibaculum finnmarkense]MCG8208220.1 site-specific integrase [Tenacibaculum finnmarkense genomovar finnmarkense]
MSEMRLFDTGGNRLYLNSTEMDKFLKLAKEQHPKLRTLAETMAYTGCRISEALQLSVRSIERDSNRIIFNSLKKRRGDIFRTVPVPDQLIDLLTIGHNLIKKQKNTKEAKTLLWKWSRQHAYELIRKLMIEAGISEGKHRSPKGLRHAYGVNAILKGVPINMLQKWMGHADIKTTSIYANAIGKEEAYIARKMWEN